VVLFFAIYAFAFVPLGRKTALEHILAISRTPAAHQAASEVGDGVTRLVKRLRTDAQRVTHASDTGALLNGPDAPDPEAADSPQPTPQPTGGKPQGTPQRLEPHVAPVPLGSDADPRHAAHLPLPTRHRDGLGAAPPAASQR
jgi:hypothetical protein